MIQTLLYRKLLARNRLQSADGHLCVCSSFVCDICQVCMQLCVYYCSSVISSYQSIDLFLFSVFIQYFSVFLSPVYPVSFYGLFLMQIND